MAVLNRREALLALASVGASVATSGCIRATKHESNEDAGLNAFLEDCFRRELSLDPERMTQLGVPGANDRWTDRSERAAHRRYELGNANLRALQARFDPQALSAEGQMSFELFRYLAEQHSNAYRYRKNVYAASHLFGVQTSIPTFLISTHQVKSVTDAQDYVARLRAAPLVLDQVAEVMRARAREGYVAPKFTYAMMRESTLNVLKGSPFEVSATDSALLEDIRTKLEGTEASTNLKQQLLTAAAAALVEQVAPAYRRFISAVDEIGATVKTDHGVWALPEGESYYRAALEQHTTTQLTADEIHAIGLEQMSRVHGEMRALLRRIGFTGDLQAFFTELRTSPRFIHPDTDEGRERYLHEAAALIDDMKGRLNELFLRKPKADVVVRRVEPFRERSAARAQYQMPAADGSRPGIFYANLADMASMPKYQMAAIAYHEAIPGHHMQVALAQELDGLPKFRRFGFYTAYGEGWGLYAEFLPKEIGLYQDPYSDFGRLCNEAWRCARLVTDTGIHAKRWTREQASDYFARNTSLAQRLVDDEILRYFVYPGQATAYQIGFLKILELREMARNALGTRFDLREFHDVLLGAGPLPLPFVSRNIERYIGSKSGATAAS